MELGKGQKIPLNENFLTFRFARPDSALEIDTAAFLTDGRGKVADDADFVFYGNARHNSGAVTHNADDSIEMDLSRIPRHVEKISLTATIYDADKRKQNFSMIRGARLKIFGTGGEIASFAPENFTVETAIVLGEVYRYKGAWKFNAVGAGYKGGLAALCNDFGIEVKDVAPPNPPPSREDNPPRPKINTRRERSRTSREKITIPPPPVNDTPPTSPPPKKV
ncbi:MAG: TerD family protein, partial [Selenomonadaceae bacterium]|nr:TerD family protein [Selenomonadaceae bacterium]